MDETNDLIIEEKEADDILDHLIAMRKTIDGLISIFMPDNEGDDERG